MSSITISAIVACSENRVIGRDGGLPWHIPEDLKHFKRMTTGKPVIMGRRTFESIGSKALPKRLNIVVSRSESSLPPLPPLPLMGGGNGGAGPFHSKDIQNALAFAKKQAAQDGAAEIMICGGAQIYKAALPVTQRIYLTIVHRTIDGDTFFPELDKEEWQETGREDHPEYSFVTMERKKK